MERVTQRAVSFFIKYGGAKETDSDLYEYGIIICLSTIINLTITFIVGFVVGMPSLLLVFLIPYLLIRSFAGGYHAKTFWGCVLISSVIVIAVVLLLYYIPAVLYFPFTGLLLIQSGVIIFRFAPAVSTNRRIEVEKYGMMKVRAFCVLGMVILACLWLFLFGAMQHMFSVSLGVGFASVTLLFCRRKL